MKIAIYGRVTHNTDYPNLQQFFNYLQNQSIGYTIFNDYAIELSATGLISEQLLFPRFTDPLEIVNAQFFYSIGGDGTILHSIPYAYASDLPILGVNVGRLGFLAAVSQYELFKVTQDLYNNSWKEDIRTLIEIEANQDLFGELNFGLNEVTIHKSNTNEMIVIHTYVNGEFLNSYWADGLIISTPTGSTAYSLACGGPIIFPQASVFVLTPIAPHSLTVRPVILPDAAVISFEIESRSGQALIALDNNTVLVDDTIEIAVKKSAKSIRLVKLGAHSYFSVLRKRLNWGVDSRN